MKIATVAMALALAGSPLAAQAANVTLKISGGQPTALGSMTGKYLAEIAAEKGIAHIQVQDGLVLTKTMQQVAEGRLDGSTGPFALAFLMSKGLGPYAALGAKKGSQIASNLRILIPFHIATFYLKAYASTGIKSYEDLRGKRVHDGPPGGGALVMARQMIQAVTGMVDGKDYTGVQVNWGQQNSIFTDGSVDAQLIPGSNPDPNIPIVASAGKVNIISIPKKIFEGPAVQRLVHTPGRVAVVQPLSDYKHYGNSVNMISDDNMFRTAGEAGAIFVNKSMDKETAYKLTAAFLATLKDFYTKVPFAKGQYGGVIDESVMGICRAGLKMHPGAVEAYKKAGYKVADCQKP